MAISPPPRPNADARYRTLGRRQLGSALLMLQALFLLEEEPLLEVVGSSASAPLLEAKAEQPGVEREDSGQHDSGSGSDTTSASDSNLGTASTDEYPRGSPWAFTWERFINS
ncbi:hypothetical protein T492DRAFT_892774 [Pavlovales sp. CCMP2436]|nr:hypothetical protein T492DRAFT_892774 [Pavlovales sp. CCMP2436]